MQLYSGIDLHSTNSYLAIIDESGKRIQIRSPPGNVKHSISRWQPSTT